MAVELATAYVSIVPSLKGAQGEIASQLGDVDTSALGKGMGEQMSKGISSGFDFSGLSQRLEGVGKSMQKVGGKLTRGITVPAAAAATAVGGIVAAFGWSRLSAVDAAQAQLRGLGYEAADVERISAGLAEALEGGMMTMAEATSAAATAMAAGVEEGAELTRYIQLLDAAVVGGTGTFQEMEQIFGRIVDQGKLTRTEFDMIAQRMPGFSAAVQEAMGVGSEAMYQMLRDGEITTADFLDIMEGFAGDMATEYANSWQGIVANTKAWVGIIGETLLGGVFEQAKGSLAEFQEYLKSDQVQQWAAEAGEAIGDAFSRIVGRIRGAIDWWVELDDWQKRVIGGLAGFAIALGPILSIIGRVMTVFAGLFRILPAVSGFIGALVSPIGLAIAGVALLAGGLYWFFTQTELGQEIWENVWASIQDTAARVGLWFQNTFLPAMQATWDVLVPAAEAAWEGIVAAAEAAVQWYNDHLAPLFSAIGDLLGEVFGQGFAKSLSKFTALLNEALEAWALWGPTVMGILEPVFSSLGAMVELAFQNVLTVIEGVLGVLTGLIGAAAAAMRGDWDAMWSSLGAAVDAGLGIIPGLAGNYLAAVDAVMQASLGNMYVAWVAGWNMLQHHVATAMVGMVSEVSIGIVHVVTAIRELPGRARDALSNIGTVLVNAGRALIQGFIDGIRMSFTGVRVALQSLTSQLPDWKGPAPRDRTILFGAGQLVIGGFVDGLENQYGAVRSTLGDLTNMLEAYEVPGLSVDDLMGEIDTFLREVSNPEGVGVSARATRAAAQPAAAPGGMSRDDMADAMRAALRGMFDNANIRLTGTEHLADGVAAVLELERSTV